MIEKKDPKKKSVYDITECCWFVTIVSIMSSMWLVCVVLVAGSHLVAGTAEVMSHVTAHFGKALAECREEVSWFFYKI